MTLAPIAIACPQCGSGDVVYTCKPDCCFNHVCSKCYATFEPVTARVGELTADLGALPPDPDASAPTAACARCGETRLFTIRDGTGPASQLVCVSCKALLTLELTEVSPG
jgi:hypothetical protein